MNAKANEGAAPLDGNQIKDLIPSHITSQAELAQWEQDNINEALAWTEKRRPRDILSEDVMRQLHRKMFCHTWRWAGKLRRTERKLGTPSSRISVELKLLREDVQYWMENQTYDPDEIGARFHHRLVFIRPFSNGNGRFARLATDLLLEHVLHRPAFTWGQARLARTGRDRIMYVESLVTANKTGYDALVEFVRS
jgi:Fic-DOC domain mobile mystery protein B